MIQRPPIATRSVTLFPYAALFRSPASTATSGAFAGRRTDGASPFSHPTRARRARRRIGRRNAIGPRRSEEHTSELQSLMRISYDVFCLKKIIQLAYSD